MTRRWRNSSSPWKIIRFLIIPISALIALLDGRHGQRIGSRAGGLFAGQYAVGIAAFDRYLASNPADNDGTVYYYRALSRRNMSYYDEALQDYKPSSKLFHASRWGDAWGEKAFIEWAQKGDYTKGAQTLLDFVKRLRTRILQPIT
jgi:hypothetical protein